MRGRVYHLYSKLILCVAFSSTAQAVPPSEASLNELFALNKSEEQFTDAVSAVERKLNSMVQSAAEENEISAEQAQATSKLLAPAFQRVTVDLEWTWCQAPSVPSVIAWLAAFFPPVAGSVSWAMAKIPGQK